LGQKCEPVWDAPVLDYSPVDYPGYVDDVDRDGLMGRSRAHHRAFVGAARGSPDPCGPVDTGVLLEQWISLLSGMLEAKGVVKVRGAVPVPKIITFQRSWGEPSNGDPRITRCENSQGRSSPEPATTRSRRRPSAMLKVMSIAARPFSPFMARMAGAGAWMDTGAMHFDLAPARAEFPDIPIHGLKEALTRTQPMSNQSRAQQRHAPHSTDRRRQTDPGYQDRSQDHPINGNGSRCNALNFRAARDRLCRTEVLCRPHVPLRPAST